MSFDWQFALSLVPAIGRSAWTTVWVTVASSVLAVCLGFALELMRRIHPVLDRVLTPAVDFLRITPILALLYFLYFVLPFHGVRLPAIVIGVATLALHYAGYLAEVFKGAIDAIPSGQFEASEALGLRPWHTSMLIVLPQVMRNAAPAASNYVLSILKSTPYLAVIAVPEMLGSALDAAADSFRYVEPMTVVGLMFLLFCFTAARAIGWFHGWLRQRDA